ncbi:alpha-keto acid decarboxylase family protein, partial [Candidatus Bipolaricaulota bacterium]|nr:alpha-keto acid decarboxylase family protein [Candidatus Bipolaricaulota bacterium]
DGYPFATTLLGKGVMRENHDQFVGVYNGHMGKETAKETVEGAEVLLNLGALMTDMNLGIWSASLDKKRMVVANSDRVRIKHHHYDHVSLKSFLEELASRISRVKSNEKVNLFADTLVSETEKDSPGKNLTVQYFYDRINDFINDENVLIADTGDSILNASNLLLPEGADYIGQAFYLSIGYSVPAALGAGLSRSDKRPVVFVGDGAFQMTAQGLSTILRRGLNPIFFLMNNSGYTIERVFHDGKYNDIHGWEYHRIPKVFGGKAGMRVKTRGDLEKALDHAATAKDELVFIEVVLEKKDWSNNLEKLERIVKNNQHSG